MTLVENQEPTTTEEKLVKSRGKCLASTVLNLDTKIHRSSNNVNHNINSIQYIIFKCMYRTRITANENYVNPCTKTSFGLIRKKRNETVKGP